MGASRVAQLVKNLPEMQEIRFNSWDKKFPWSREGFRGDSVSKESTCNVGDLGSTPGLGRSPGKGKNYPLQYSGLENSMDCVVHSVAKSWTRLSDCFTFINIGM